MTTPATTDPPSPTPTLQAIWWTTGREIRRADADGRNARVVVAEASNPWSCKIAGKKLYWAEFGSSQSSIRRSNLDGSNVEALVTSTVNILGLGVDVDAGKMYWSESGRLPGDAATIKRANLDGSGSEVLVDIAGGAASIALDVTSRKIYWVDMSGIRRANMDGSNAEYLVQLGHSNTAYSIGLDVSSYALYWVEFASGSSVLKKADLDGSNVLDIATHDRHSFPIAVAVANGKLYWSAVSDTHGSSGAINRSDFDGTNVEEVLGSSDAHSKPFHIDVTDKDICWTSYGVFGTGKLAVGRANVDGSGAEDVIVTRGTRSGVRGIALDVTANKVYWNERNAVRRANLDGSGEEDFVTQSGGEIAQGIALVGDDVYWASYSWADNRGVIRRAAKQDGSAPDDIVVIEGDPILFPQHIAVSGSHVFWTTGNKLSKANLDGSGVTDLVTNTASGDLAVDVANGKIYWAIGADSGTIGAPGPTGPGEEPAPHPSTTIVRRANLDGTEVEELVTDASGDRVGGIALDTGAGRMYWVMLGTASSISETRTVRVRVAELTGKSAREITRIDVAGAHSYTDGAIALEIR